MSEAVPAHPGLVTCWLYKPCGRSLSQFPVDEMIIIAVSFLESARTPESQSSWLKLTCHTFISTNSFFFFFCPLFFIWDTFSFWNPGYPDAHYADQAGLDSQRSLGLCLLSAGMKRMHYHAPHKSGFYIQHLKWIVHRKRDKMVWGVSLLISTETANEGKNHKG